jgi:two-component system NtrC family sensor kinase
MKVMSHQGTSSKSSMKISIRWQLAIGFLVTILTTGITSMFVGAWLLRRDLSEQAQQKARNDLNSARLIFYQTQSKIREKMELASYSLRMRRVYQEANPSVAQEILEQARREMGLDALYLLDAQGRWLLSAQAVTILPEKFKNEAVIRRILKGEQAAVATVVIPTDELQLESPELAKAARIPIVAGPGEFDTRVTEVAAAMLFRAAASVGDENSHRRGILLGSRLINRDTQIVDQIRETIYQGEYLEGKAIGEGSICLGDVRVATNFHTAEGKRAIGTHVDAAVKQQVLVKGLPYIDRAFVVNAQHVTAYEPIRGPSGQILGILSIGIPEKKYFAQQKDASVVFFTVTLCGVLLALTISSVIARRITCPIRQLATAARRLANGELNYHVTFNSQIREVATLGECFNQMADSLREQERQLKHRTEEQISKAEKLAMIGRLAAGVAHEINNPLGGIMLFSNLLLRKAPAEGPTRENLERIAKETKRCQKIVQGLLEFARHREPEVKPLDVNQLLEKTLELVEHQELFHNIETIKDYSPDCLPVAMDAGQMQQVFVNIIINAVEAMNKKGRLTLSTRAEDEGRHVLVSIQDTGSGISPEYLERLFEPFFTTKEVGKGTGLGLSISRGIVENHQGQIWAESTLGVGTTFYLRFPSLNKDAPCHTTPIS